MIEKILLTGTRAPATLDLARRLCREGFQVIGADSLHFPLGRFSRAYAAHYRVPSPIVDRPGFLREIEGIVANEGVDLLWPTCEEVFHLSSAWERLAEGSQLLFPPMEILDRLHHKLRFARWVEALGEEIRAPDSWAGDEAPAGADLVWKPLYSRFAARTRFEPPAGDRGRWMAQRRLHGREFSSWALCRDGVVQILTQYECPARAGLGAGCAFVPTWSDAVARFTAAVARKLGYTGCLAFDFMEESGRLYVLECNPRLTSGLHVLGSDVRWSAVLSGIPAPCPPLQCRAELSLPMLLVAGQLPGRSPDVIFSGADLGPSLGQGAALAELLWRAIRHNVSILAASTLDIEYNGE